MKPYYQADGVTLYLGDCREILPHLETASIDLILTDPPYGVSMPGVTNGRDPGMGTRNFDFFKNDSPRESGDLALAIIAESERLLKPHGSGYAWVGHRQFAELTLDLEKRNWTTRFLVWNKSCPAPPPPGAGWPSGAELCLYWFRSGRRWTHDGTNAPRSNVFDADSYRHGQPGKVSHPTQKPFEVITPLILASSCRGDTILDPCSGSGTTLIAAKRQGRMAIGMELEEPFAEIAANRLSQKVLQFTD